MPQYTRKIRSFGVRPPKHQRCFYLYFIASNESVPYHVSLLGARGRTHVGIEEGKSSGGIKGGED
eukprot:scaffold233456_cov28-Tisochrysis_lutea.AAC.4